MSLITLENVSKRYDDRALLESVTLAIAEGERVGLLGANGSGKSTLLRILAGEETQDDGTRVVRRGLRLGYLEQEPALDPRATVRDVVRGGLVERTRVLGELEALHQALTDAKAERLDSLLARQDRLETELERLGGHDVEHQVESTMQALDLREFDARCGELSGGERRRVALARLLLTAPELLLLDEPTNHLDAFVTEWLENWFLETRTPLLLVTHDRYFLDRVVDRIVEIDRGRLIGYDGSYGDYLEARAARLQAEGNAESARLNVLRRETAWMRRGPPARTTKSKARIQRFNDLVDAAPTALSDDLEFELPPGPRLGTRVVKLVGVSKSYAGKLVLPPLDLELEQAARVGVVGPNGAGKSTLLRILLGELEPDTGTRDVGETVRFMGIDQQRSELDPDATIAEELAGRGDVVRVGERVVRVQSFLDRFGFPTRVQGTRVGRLSGGERNRLLLAKLLLAGGNVLVLDEPTNDLDLGTLRALEEALVAFPGVVVVISHDRWFLDRIATRILHLDGRGRARWHHGDLSSLLARIAEEARAAGARHAAQPAAANTRSGAPPAPADARQKRRITPWQEQELAELEAAIAAEEARLGELDGRLADPALYAQPRERADGVRREREQVAAKLEQLFERWEALESLR